MIELLLGALVGLAVGFVVLIVLKNIGQDSKKELYEFIELQDKLIKEQDNLIDKQKRLIILKDRLLEIELQEHKAKENFNANAG